MISGLSEVILSEQSPNGRWSLVMYITPGVQYIQADIRNIDRSVGCCSELGGISIGPWLPDAVAISEVIVRWDLPDNVLGLYVGSDCYGLFRCGAGRRRARGKFRAGRPENAFTSDEIEWFCAKSHVQFRRTV